MAKTTYHRVTVKLVNGFQYSYTCIGRMLEGMKKSSQSHWTDSITVTEITEEEHRESWYSEPKPIKKTNPQFSSLEDFFDGEKKETPKPKTRKPRKSV